MEEGAQHTQPPDVGGYEGGSVTESVGSFASSLSHDVHSAFDTGDVAGGNPFDEMYDGEANGTHYGDTTTSSTISPFSSTTSTPRSVYNQYAGDISSSSAESNQPIEMEAGDFDDDDGFHSDTALRTEATKGHRNPFDYEQQLDEVTGKRDSIVATNATKPSEEDSAEDAKPLGIIGLVSMVYFLVAGGAYGTEDLGGSIPALYALLGILLIPWVWSVPISLMVAELATALPADSGFLLWSKRAFGDFVYWVDGWILILVIIIDQTIYPRIFVDYLQNGEFFRNSLGISLNFWTEWAVCVGYIGMCMVINLLGIANIGKATFFFSLFTLVPFTLFVIFGVFSSDFDPSLWFKTDMTPNKSQDWDISLYLSVLVWATCGYEYSGFLAPDVRRPARTYPIGMVATNILMLCTYFFPIAMCIAVAKDQSYIYEGAYPSIADSFGFGSWFGVLMTVGGLLSTMGTYIAYLHTSSTALRALAIDGTAPRVFNMFPSLKVPVISILFFSGTTAILVVLDFEVLVQTASFLYCIHAIFLCCSFICLRWKEPSLVRPYKLPLGNIGATCIVLLPVCVALIQGISLFVENWLYGVLALVAISVGIISYVLRYYYHRWQQQRIITTQSVETSSLPEDL